MELKELEEIILYHNDKYTNGTPEISDAEYDLLIEQLKIIDPTNKLLLEVGAPVPSYGKKVKHYKMMGSLMKIHDSINELNEWYDKYPADEYVWSDKLDGCPDEIVYRKGILYNAATRGDGLIGMDVTDNVKMIEGFPIKINIVEDEFILRGEFVIPLDFFNKNLKDKFANPRNAVSGILQSKDPNDLIGKGLKFIVYKILGHEDKLFGKDLITEELYINTHVGGEDYTGKFCRHKFVELHKGKLTQDIINEYVKSKRAKLNYLIDGLVCTINNTEVRESYGYHGTETKYPKGSIAFKFAPTVAETILTGVEWNVGRTGKVFPVGILQPVDLEGCMVGRVSLHNHSEIKRIGIKIGSKIQICKSGDIIPVVLNVLDTNGTDILIPMQCPTCGDAVTVDDKNIWCVNPNCKDRLVQRIVCHLRILEVKEIGEKIIEKLYDAGKIRNISDLYSITKEDIMSLDRSGEKTADNFIKAMSNIPEIPLNKFLDSLGIDGIGTGISKLLTKKFKTINEIINIEKDKLIGMEGIGPILTEQIVCGIKENQVEMGVLYHMLKVKNIEEKTGKFKGLTFCNSGTLNIKRNELIKRIESEGGEYISLKKGLTYFISAPDSVPDKIEKARKLGAKIITEEEFNSL